MLRIFKCKYLCEHTLPIFLHKNLGVELRDHAVTMFNILRNSQTILQSFHNLTTPPECVRDFITPYPQHLLMSISAIPGVVK